LWILIGDNNEKAYSLRGARTENFMAKKSRFIERSIIGVLFFLQESLFSDEYASKRGFLQAREPRLKLLAILVLLLAVLFAKNIVFIAAVYLFCLLLAFSSSISIGFFLKRTWLFIPLFAFCIAIPALFSIFSPGEPLVSFKLFTIMLHITKQGVSSALIFFLRVLTSVSLSVLLVLTTKHNCLLKALRSFRLPQVFILTLGMCYRYIYLFIEIIQNTYLAIKSRVGFVSSVGKGQRIVAWNVASLWQRSYDMHNQVYQAMLSRGYSGEPKILEEFQVGLKDIFSLGASILVFIGVIWRVYFLN
jgi:cobalt/nickel transport system permease protein